MIISEPDRLFDDVEDLPDAHGVVVPAADHHLPLRSPERLVDLLLGHMA
ncbi:hypothetical protein ACFWB2_13425 [Streptomyces virginiae]